MTTYNIIRHYLYDGPETDHTIMRGLTLQGAQKWCNDPRTSSRTATSEWAVAHTEKYGPWFDGYEEETS
jgi:hypothetical protein